MKDVQKKSKKVQKSPKSKVTGTGSGTAWDEPPKAAPLLKADSAVRVIITPYNILANYAHHLPPKAADRLLSFCTHKEKGRRDDPQAKSEQRPTGGRAYQLKDSAVRVQSPPLAKAGSAVRAFAALTRLKASGCARGLLYPRPTQRDASMNEGQSKG